MVAAIFRSQGSRWQVAVHVWLGLNIGAEDYPNQLIGPWEIWMRFLKWNYTLRIFPPAIDIIPTLLAVVYSNGKYTN